MIDLHFHCLPGIDDGPADWDAAVALCRAAAADGIETIVATPHVLRDDWINDQQKERNELVMKLNHLLGGKPAILPGCESFFSSDAVELWERGPAGPLTGLNRSNYLLVEFPAGVVPPNAEAIFHEFSVAGVTPVIAHPERNGVFMKEPDRLAGLIARGAIAQLTAASVIGEFGRPAAQASVELLRRNLIHIVASDSHSTDRRPPRMSKARAKIARDWGREVENALFIANPAAIIKNEPLPWNAR